MARSGTGAANRADFCSSRAASWSDVRKAPLVPAGGIMKRVFTLVISALVLFFSCNAAYAQSSAADAQLNGSVRDQTGSVIAKAAVTLRNVDTNQTYKTTSNGVGFYILPNVPPGNYELTAESPGFGKYPQTGIVLRVAQVATIDMNLKVAGT